eukprot:m.127047 g.127047  ORF g.127047 m.127047 type:complete len:974 (-) comp17405_c0_seq1:105-3026(-)
MRTNSITVAALVVVTTVVWADAAVWGRTKRQQKCPSGYHEVKGIVFAKGKNASLVCSPLSHEVADKHVQSARQRKSIRSQQNPAGAQRTQNQLRARRETIFGHPQQQPPHTRIARQVLDGTFGEFILSIAPELLDQLYSLWEDTFGSFSRATFVSLFGDELDGIDFTASTPAVVVQVVAAAVLNFVDNAVQPAGMCGLRDTPLTTEEEELAQTLATFVDSTSFWRKVLVNAVDIDPELLELSDLQFSIVESVLANGLLCDISTSVPCHIDTILGLELDEVLDLSIDSLELVLDVYTEVMGVGAGEAGDLILEDEDDVVKARQLLMPLFQNNQLQDASLLENTMNTIRTGLRVVAESRAAQVDKTFVGVEQATASIVTSTSRQTRKAMGKSSRRGMGMSMGKSDSVRVTNIASVVSPQVSYTHTRGFAASGKTNNDERTDIDSESLSFLGSNSKVLTQILMDRMEEDEALTHHLLQRYNRAEFKYTNPLPFHDGRTTTTDEPQAVSELPILKSMYMSSGEYPVFIVNQVENTNSTVTSIPTMQCLRTFCSNMYPSIHLLLSLVLAQNLGPDNAIAPSQYATEFTPLSGALGLLVDEIVEFIDLPLPPTPRASFSANLSAIRDEYFLGDSVTGASFPSAPRDLIRAAFRRDAASFTPTTPTEDYASVFAQVPLLADIGEGLSSGEGTYVRQYNSDHNLATLSLSHYFGTQQVVDGVEYADLWAYITANYLEPIGVQAHEVSGLGFASEAMAAKFVAPTFELREFEVMDLQQDPAGTASLLDGSYQQVMLHTSDRLRQLPVEFPSEPPAILGTGTLYMGTEAWCKLVADHLTTYPEKALDNQLPDGFHIAVGGGFDDPVDTWNTFGGRSEYNVTSGEVESNWGGYAGSRLTMRMKVEEVTFTNTTTYYRAQGKSAIAPEVTTETTTQLVATHVQVVFSSNQQDLFGLSFQSNALLYIGETLLSFLQFLYSFSPTRV